MRKLRTVENIVRPILEQNEEARNDDMVLYLLVCNDCIRRLHGTDKATFEDVMWNYKAFQIPCFESVRRTRQMIQSANPELGCRPEIRRARKRRKPHTGNMRLPEERRQYKLRDMSTLSQKIKVLSKLYESGCKTEKELQSLSMESILKIPNITIADMTVIMELQKQTKANRLFSYLGGGVDGQSND